MSQTATITSLLQESPLPQLVPMLSGRFHHLTLATAAGAGNGNGSGGGARPGSPGRQPLFPLHEDHEGPPSPPNRELELESPVVLSPAPVTDRIAARLSKTLANSL